MRLATGRSAWELDPEWRREDRSVVRGTVGLHDVVRMGHGDPIVVLPGLAGGWKLLEPFGRALASQKTEVILVGWAGESDQGARGNAASLADEAASVMWVIDQLGLERPTVLGVSYGAAVALELAVESPGRVGSLVLSGGETRFRQRRSAAFLQHVLERYPLPSDAPFVNQFFNVLHGAKPEPGPIPDWIVRHCWETPQRLMADRLKFLLNFDVSDRLWRIDAPTLVLAGARDVVVTPDRQEDLARSIIESRFETIEGAGHVGFLTHRRAFRNAIRSHRREVARSVC